MDLQGQKLSEIIYQYTILIFAVVSFLLGYFLRSFSVMMWTYAAGAVLACVIAVPDWPYFNQHPLKFLPVPEKKIAEKAASQKPAFKKPKSRKT
mmetsp:Transcript_39724/g.55151  ORF Transcript_39724/g.55151 Transcript_39724/m.55151 type:complete len:94 (+) Transcript_39724:132-413(+)